MGTILLPASDLLVLMVPVLAIFGIGMFGLDERLVNTKRLPGRQRSFCGIDGNGTPVLSDPDGRPWRKRPGARKSSGNYTQSSLSPDEIITPKASWVSLRSRSNL